MMLNISGKYEIVAEVREEFGSEGFVIEDSHINWFEGF